MTTDGPPLADEFELSLFGPGVGECILAHIGAGEWLIVDSCLDWKSRTPVALMYLHRIGVDVASAVKLLVVTHWHDDHMRGAAAVLDRAQLAAFSCSIALQSEQFLKVLAQTRGALMQSSGIDEFDKISEILLSRRSSRMPRTSVGPKWAAEDKRLYHRAGADVPRAEVWSLSPSSASITRAIHEFGEMIPFFKAPKRHAVRQKANDVAVALWLEFGTIRALLGSDVQADTHPARGWGAIVGSPARPQGRSHIFKVAHHGSRNAHSEDVWTTMLVPEPIAVVTPFASTSSPLPTQEDQKRIASLAPRSYCTAEPSGWSLRRRGQPVDRMIERSVRSIRAVEGRQTGHVRIRRVSGEADFRIEVFNGAYRLSRELQPRSA